MRYKYFLLIVVSIVEECIMSFSTSPVNPSTCSLLYINSVQKIALMNMESYHSKGQCFFGQPGMCLKPWVQNTAEHFILAKPTLHLLTLRV